MPSAILLAVLQMCSSTHGKHDQSSFKHYMGTIREGKKKDVFVSMQRYWCTLESCFQPGSNACLNNQVPMVCRQEVGRPRTSPSAMYHRQTSCCISEPLLKPDAIPRKRTEDRTLKQLCRQGAGQTIHHHVHVDTALSSCVNGRPFK